MFKRGDRVRYVGEFEQLIGRTDGLVLERFDDGRYNVAFGQERCFAVREASLELIDGEGAVPAVESDT